MAVEIKPEQAYAYAELLEVLELMDQEYVKKVPKKLMNIFKTYADGEYEKHIDVGVPLEEQELHEKTTALLAMLLLNYWCENEEEKQSLLEVYKENERKYQEELKEKYNPENIFNNNVREESVGDPVSKVTQPAAEQKATPVQETNVETPSENTSSTAPTVSTISVEDMTVEETSTEPSQVVENGEGNLPIDMNSLPWYQKIVTKVKAFISKLFKKK